MCYYFFFFISRHNSYKKQMIAISITHISVFTLFPNSIFFINDRQ